MTHTFGHLFGMEHCIYYHCRMNGCISIDEQETSPVYLRPVCLRKLHNAWVSIYHWVMNDILKS